MLASLNIIRWQDILDILVVAFIIYQLFTIIRGTRSVQMALGLLVVGMVYFMSLVLDLAVLQWLLKTFLGSLFLIIVIVFQQDIRRALTQVGKSPFQSNTDIAAKELDEIIRALFYLSKRRIGALVVIERDTGLREFLESGFRLNANLSKELLISIFMPASPLHDGGVIIYKGKIQTAGCILPLSKNPNISKRFGTRHRAAIGLSEETDAVVLVVSEETQEISLVEHGMIITMRDEQALADTLRNIFLPKDTGTAASWKQWMGRS